jgi:hypothetical protein
MVSTVLASVAVCVLVPLAFVMSMAIVRAVPFVDVTPVAVQV